MTAYMCRAYSSLRSTAALQRLLSVLFCIQKQTMIRIRRRTGETSGQWHERQGYDKFLKFDSELKAVVTGGERTYPGITSFNEYGFKDVFLKPIAADRLMQVCFSH